MEAPRLGLNDLLYTHRAYLRASSSDTDHGVALLANRKLGSYWAPTAAAAAAGAVTVDVFPVNGQLIPVNWYFDAWTAGAAAAPDGWTLDGSGGTIARGSTTPKVGAYSAVVTRSGTDVRLYQEVLDAVALRGRQVTAGAWVTCGTAARAYVAVYDGTTRTTSSAHTGGGAQEWLSVSSAKVAAAATSVVIECWVKTGNVAATFEGPLLCLGATAAQTPHATSCDYVAFAGHTLATDAVAVSVQHSSDNFSNVTTDATFTPASDGDVFRRFTPASGSAWRLSFAGGTYSPAPQVQVAALGLSRALPRGVVIGFDPRSTETQVESSRSAKGAPLGRLVRQALAKLRLAQPVLMESDLDGLADLRTHAVLNAQPFFLAWDLGEHQNDAAFVWTIDNVRWSAPLERLADGLGTRAWALDLEAVAR